MDITKHDDRLDAIIDAASTVEIVSAQFNFIEGPIWHPREQHLTFSDIPESRLYRYQGGEITTYREPSNMANGNTYDKAGRILSCLHGTSQVVREENGVVETIASHYDGKELNSPNDIVVSRAGTIYFTDPTYGRQGQHGVQRDLELDFRGVYRIDADGSLHLLANDFTQPNGLCLGLDETTLYVADTSERHVRRFDLTDDGLSGGDVFCESPAPDGLKIDSLGNLYAGGPRGVHVYDKDDGTFLGVIGSGELFCANFTWAGEALDVMYLTASTTLFRTTVKVPGIPLF